MNYIFWNVRGLGSGEKRRVVREVSNANQSEIIELSEIKINLPNPMILRQLSSEKINTWVVKNGLGVSKRIIMGFNLQNYELHDSWEEGILTNIETKTKERQLGNCYYQGVWTK